MCLVPTEDLIDLARALLSDSQVKIYRSTLNMPALILDKEEKMVSRFISTNGLVEDPCAVEKERSMINPWTSEERKIFMDKLASFGKDFRKIASFLDHKTTADCVEFYYKNHKLDCFEKAPKKPNFLKQRKSQPTSTYLLASRKRWNREGNAASLDILGSASAIAAKVDYGLEIQQKCTSTFFSGASSDHKEPTNDDVSLARSNSLDIFHNERETLAADVLASICGSLSSEAMSSCITSSVDLGEDYQDWRCQRVGSSIKCSFTPEVTQNVDDESSDESCGEVDHTAWTDEEKALLIQAVSSYGKDFTMISRCVRSRSRDQCKVFYSKARKILGLDLIQPGPCNAMPCDVNGGGSDTEDACDVETGSVNCSERSGCKMEDDFPSPDVKSSRESNIVGTLSLKPNLDKCEDNSGTSSLDMDSGPVLENSMP
ncbi:Duplicated homeodomain-like superfamily protein [Abeliophyllum distichum]|uniref:Duplicated homeodomain-like superfamily protein n=1 Tax=Abeliophyllum distichum TaxID=126358 RepID=A0ABD1UN25_9LAMI